MKVNTDGVSITSDSFQEEIVDVPDKTLGLGKVISDLRRKKGLRQCELANAIGLSRPALSNLEAGRQNISVLQISEIAEAMGLTVTITFEDKQ